MKVNTVIPSYNALEMLLDCQKAVDTQYKDGCTGTLVTIHNGAVPEKPFEATYCNTREFKNEKNNGFTKAINQGIKEAWKDGAEFVWLLNQDAIPSGGALQALVDRMIASPKCGIASSMILDMARPDHIVHGGTGAVMPGIHKSGWKSEGHLSVPTKEKWVTFCSVLVRMETVQDIGLLDERFYLICSDSDYCFTARSRGWQVWYEPKSEVLHGERHGVSRVVSTTRTKEQEMMMWHDQRQFLEKWTGELFRDLNLEEFPSDSL